MWLLRASERGVSAKAWWTRWAGFLAFATCFEMLVLKVAGTTWIYYDKQPFMVLEVPVFTPWTYVSFTVTIAAGTVALARYLPRRQQWLIIPAVPMLMVAGHAMTALPEGIAFYGTHNELLRHLGALGSAAFALVVSHLASLAYRKPLAYESTALDGMDAIISPTVQARANEVLVSTGPGTA
jgi:hypothetical protein